MEPVLAFVPPLPLSPALQEPSLCVARAPIHSVRVPAQHLPHRARVACFPVLSVHIPGTDACRRMLAHLNIPCTYHVAGARQAFCKAFYEA